VAPELYRGSLELTSPGVRLASNSHQTTVAMYSNGILLPEKQQAVTAAEVALRRAIEEEACTPTGEAPDALVRFERTLIAFEERFEAQREPTAHELACMAQEKREPSEWTAGAFLKDSADQARVDHNKLVQEGRLPVRKQAPDNLLAADGERFALTATTYENLLSNPTRDSYSLFMRASRDDSEDSPVSLAGTDVQATKMVEVNRVVFSSRAVAGLCLTLKSLGKDAVVASMQAVGRDERAVTAYTNDVHAAVVKFADDFEASIARVFMPGRFLDDTRTRDFIDSLLEEPRDGRAQAPEKVVRRMLVRCLLVVFLKPEAAKHVLEHHGGEMDAFVHDPSSTNKQALHRVPRDLWAHAPHNGGSRQNLRGDAGVASWERRCCCPVSSGCAGKPENKPGRATVTTGTQRYQPPSYHDSQTSKADVKGTTRNQGMEMLGSVADCLNSVKTMQGLRAALDAGEAPVRAWIEAHIAHCSDVRAIAMSRLLFLAFHVATKAVPDAMGNFRIQVPGDQSQPAALAKNPLRRFMAFVAHNGVHLSRLQQQQVAGESMRYAQRNGPAASAAWWRDVLNERPELAVLTRVVEDHMCLTSPQDLQREEELHCEVAKGVVGNAIAQDILGKEATLRGYWHADPQMRTGFPPSVPRLNRRLSSHLTCDGQVEIVSTSFAPDVPRAAASPAQFDTAAAGQPDSGRPSSAAVARARQNLHAAQVALKAACDKRDAAMASATAQRGEIQSLKRLASFQGLCDLTASNPMRAFNMWFAASGATESGEATLEIHLDVDDHPLLLNHVASIGIDPDGRVVSLNGAMLMVVLTWSESSLSGAALEGREHGHDAAGNIVLLEPAPGAIKLPPSYTQAEVPTSPSAALSMLRRGRGVIAFFPAGGFTAGQFGHHWHAVTRMDAGDLAAGLIRFAMIAYPNAQVCVAGHIVHQQWLSCTYEAAKELAKSQGAAARAEAQGQMPL
jgi:hypothetical protein